MRITCYKAIFMIGACANLNGTMSKYITIVNNGSENVSIELRDDLYGSGHTIATGSHLFLRPGQSCCIKNAYDVQDKAPCDIDIKVCSDAGFYREKQVKSICLNFERSQFTSIISMPLSSITIDFDDQMSIS